MSTLPVANPMLAVGTYDASTSLGSGYNIVFDYLGGGTIFNSAGTLAGVNSTDNLINLTNPRVVQTSGVKLTSAAIPITMGSTAYILDQVRRKFISRD